MTATVLPTVTAGPFVNKDGKWCLIARRGDVVVHATAPDRAENYDARFALTDKALAAILYAFRQAWNLTEAEALEALEVREA